MNVNKVFLAGNLTRDVELKSTTGGTSVANLGIAVNRRWKDKAGETKEEVTFVDCEAWGATAETMAKHLNKGRPVFIEGRLKLETWDDKEGKKQYRMRVVVESFQFVGGREEKPQETTRQNARPPTQSAKREAAMHPEDIPF